MDKKFRMRMKHLRSMCKYSRRDLERVSGVSYSVIYGLEEYDKRDTSVSNIIKLARAFNVSLDYFLTGEEFR